jgi:membrane associated rhomboid family serine protease
LETIANFPITVLLVAVTCITSYLAFSNERIMDNWIFYPPSLTHDKQWYRLITCGFVHRDVIHLGFNMLALYLFGKWIELDFLIFFGGKGRLIYVVFYLSAIVAAILPSYFKHKNNHSYASLGASGGVSAIVFASIIISPFNEVELILIPIGIPGFIFGIIYLVATSYMDRKGINKGVNHSAHFWGSLYGIAFTIVACNLFSYFRPVQSFIDQFSYWIKSL